MCFAFRFNILITSRFLRTKAGSTVVILSSSCAVRALRTASDVHFLDASVLPSQRKYTKVIFIVSAVDSRSSSIILDVRKVFPEPGFPLRWKEAELSHQTKSMNA